MPSKTPNTCVFFFSSRRRHTRLVSDWSSDVCSSDLRSKPRPFDVLVVMNQSRLARRQRYAVDIVHDLTDLGVRIFHYQTGLERKMETATDRFMVSVDGFSRSEERRVGKEWRHRWSPA